MLEAKKSKEDIKIVVSRSLEGTVISDKMNKTITVKVWRTFRHPLFGKVVKKFKNYKVHDEKEIASIGDFVEIAECRPLSKTKHMILKRVISKLS